MKLQVLIHRQREDEPKTGTLQAYVLMGNRRGENLLDRTEFTLVDSAIQHCDEAIMQKFKLVDVPEIEYRIEDWLEENRATPQDDKSRDAAGDSVGRDWRKMGPSRAI